VTAHLASAVVLALSVALSSGAQTGATQKPAPQTAAAQKPGIVAVTVMDESGSPIQGAMVSIQGVVDRRSATGADGTALLSNIPAGTIRCRITKDGFITLDKEVTVKAGAKATADAVLAAAPKPPPPPPAPKPEPKPAPAAAGPVGQPRTLSIGDLAEQMLNDKAPLVERDLGCSVATTSKLILVRDTLASHSHENADEIIYLMAGDATIRIFDKETPIAAGWYAMVPRGVSHSISKRGRNAPILLSVRSGEPCTGK